MVWASAMYQSLRVACCGSLAWTKCRLSISASAIASVEVPVRISSSSRRVLTSVSPFRLDFIPSHSRQAFRPEDLTRLLGGFRRRRLHGTECVLQAESFPLEPAQLVEGQDLDAFDIAQTSREAGDLPDVIDIVGQSRN